ncbi:MAG TPA: hypothetical protein VH189_02290 [Rhizomicrobium sp.]|jgi:hypothetical protein|nr:hypothetical protein [Rhizomicrobium sp.]
MPICLVPFREKGETQDKVQPDGSPQPDWREPPGYLGEAVRRAKRISELNRQKVPKDR